MKTLAHEAQFGFSFNWRLKVYLPESVHLGRYKETRSKDGSRAFRGREIIEGAPPILVLEGPNIIVTVGKQQVGDMLIDESGYDTGLTYCALGAGDTTPLVTDTQLEDEGGGSAMRKTITSRSRLVNVMTLSTFFTKAQCTLAIKEAAIFGHSTAGAAENSGILFTHWLVDFDNSGAGYDLTFDHVTTLG